MKYLHKKWSTIYLRNFKCKKILFGQIFISMFFFYCRFKIISINYFCMTFFITLNYNILICVLCMFINTKIRYPKYKYILWTHGTLKKLSTVPVENVVLLVNWSVYWHAIVQLKCILAYLFHLYCMTSFFIATMTGFHIKQ